MLQGWVIANHKLSKYSNSNGHPHEPSVRNLLNPLKHVWNSLNWIQFKVFNKISCLKPFGVLRIELQMELNP